MIAHPPRSLALFRLASRWSMVAVTVGSLACAENGVGPVADAPGCVVQSVVVAPLQASVTVGQSLNLSATISATNCATAPAVTWTSGNAAVSVQPNGNAVRVTGVNAGGGVTVTASAGGQSGSALVTVSAPVPSTIVFTAGGGNSRELWRMDPTGANMVRLTTNAEGDYSATLSKDGAQIAYVHNGALYRMASDGTNPVLVASAAGQVIAPDWSPDGTQFAYCDFSGTILTGTCPLKIVTAAGAFVRTLGTSGRYQTHPDWSPDGASLVFADGSSPLGCCVIRITPAAGGPTQLRFDTTASGGNPVYSPDGSRIAFHVGYRIAVMNVAGGPITLLTADSIVASHPTWSPDGTRLAYEAELPGQTMSDIWVMDADGSGKVNITNTPSIDEFQPAWGRKVAGALPAPASLLAGGYDRRAAHGPRSTAPTFAARAFDGMRADAGVGMPR